MKNTKKLLCLLLCVVLLCPIFFCGCNNSNFVEKFSKDVNNYLLEVSIDEINHKVNVKQTTEYYNSTDTSLDNICFHIYPKSFCQDVKNKPVGTLYESKAYPNGQSYASFSLSKLTVNKNEVEQIFEGTDNTILKVNLKEDLYPGERVNICFEYEIVLPNINHRFGYGDNTINLGNFYPIACIFENGAFNKSEYNCNGDPFYSDIANYEVLIKNNENYIVATTGNVLSCEIVDHEKQTKVQAKAVRDFDIILSNKFQMISQQVEKTTINYFYYNDNNAQTSLQTAVDSLTTFNNLIGKYPYQTLNIVESNFVYGGMEYPNQVMISDNLEKYEDYQNTIIHEIAHQWWYGLVGNNEYNYGWLDEGLTEYTTALFYEQNEQYGLTYSEIMANANNSYCMFVDVYTDIFGNVDTTMNRKLSEYATEPEYVYIAYVKGMLLFDSLRDVLGKKSFNKCLKDYFEAYKGQNASPEALIASFEKSSLRELESFFKSWINGTVVVVRNT